MLNTENTDPYEDNWGDVSKGLEWRHMFHSPLCSVVLHTMFTLKFKKKITTCKKLCIIFPSCRQRFHYGKNILEGYKNLNKTETETNNVL